MFVSSAVYKLHIAKIFYYDDEDEANNLMYFIKKCEDKINVKLPSAESTVCRTYCNPFKLHMPHPWSTTIIAQKEKQKTKLNAGATGVYLPAHK